MGDFLIGCAEAADVPGEKWDDAMKAGMDVRVQAVQGEGAREALARYREAVVGVMRQVAAATSAIERFEQAWKESEMRSGVVHKVRVRSDEHDARTEREFVFEREDEAQSCAGRAEACGLTVTCLKVQRRVETHTPS